MPTYIPDQLIPGGSNFPVIDQVNIKGGQHTVSAIAVWASEIEPRYRKGGMTIYDRSANTFWSLGSDLVSLTLVADVALTQEAIDLSTEAIEKFEETTTRLDDIQGMTFALARTYINTQTRAILDVDFLEDEQITQREVIEELSVAKIAMDTRLLDLLNDFETSQIDQDEMRQELTTLQEDFDQLKDDLGV